MSRERSGHLRGCSGHSEVIEGSTTPPDYLPWEISMTTFTFLRSSKSKDGETPTLVSDKKIPHALPSQAKPTKTMKS